jgi:hypothetical protein
MKNLILKIVLIAGFGLCFSIVYLTRAQEKVSESPAVQNPAEARAPQNAKYEYGMILWDKSDRIQIITPEDNQRVRVYKFVKLPHDISEEEFCVTWAINSVAKSGWEPVTLEMPRVLLRRDLDR